MSCSCLERDFLYKLVEARGSTWTAHQSALWKKNTHNTGGEGERGTRCVDIHMESLEEGETISSQNHSSSIATRGSGVRKLTGVIGVIVVALGFIFFGTRAEPATGGTAAAAAAAARGAARGAAAGAGAGVLDLTARWMDPASSFRRSRGRNHASACQHRMEQCRLQQRPGMM